MKIGTIEKYIELFELERIPPELPCAGDVRLSVRIKVDENSEQDSEIWLEFPEIKKFIANLKALKHSHAGNAIISSMSPDEFNLEIRASENANHLEVKTTLQPYKKNIEEQITQKIFTDFHIKTESIPNLITGMEKLIN